MDAACRSHRRGFGRADEPSGNAALDKAAILTGKPPNPELRKIADKEDREKQPVLEKAREFDRQAAEANERSEHFLRSQETLEIAVTMLQVAIVVLSIATLASAVFLTIVAAAATVLGVGFALVGLLP